MTCRWTGGEIFASCEHDGAVVGSRACYRVACEGVSLLRQVCEPPAIDEPAVEDTWVTFKPREDWFCIVVPGEAEPSAAPLVEHARWVRDVFSLCALCLRRRGRGGRMRPVWLAFRRSQRTAYGGFDPTTGLVLCIGRVCGVGPNP